jgi:adenine specific DNA methylase Mod
MPTLNWGGKNLEKDRINADNLKIKNFRLIEINHTPIIDKYDFDETPITKSEELSISKKGSGDVWYNLLFWGDNLSVMNYLLKDYSNSLDLIYIDPPFATGNSFNYKILIGEKSGSEISEAYSDIWSGGIETYISFIYDRLKLMKALLSESGSIYLHLDWHISHYIKVIMDEIFGKENFRNEIIWAYPAASVKTRRFFIRSFDTILFYTKSDDYIFNDNPEIYMEYSNRVKKNLKKDEQGTFYYRGGSHGGKKLSQKVYLQEEGIFPRDVWNDIPYIRANTLEYQGFSTQKPERLLKRIILASSNQGDIVADFFCGTGTTLSVAEKLNRRWIGSDIIANSINITKKRIFNIYSSNDLYSWEKKYKSFPKPFKLISSENKIEDFTIPNNLLKKDRNIELKVKNSEPRITIIIERHEHLVSLHLSNYIMPKIELISSEMTEKVNTFSDWIDNWAVDYNYNENCFNTSWISFRAYKKRKLKLFSKPFLYENQGEYMVGVKVTNIFGGETIQSYKVTIQ